ncbi:hypothetical protein Zmor_027333 [Zophobas morio]|uniref:Uncharacterized protein n=1 Tax=Zophobas morio TaxID=2755281 RepID=A0AA38M395_9CUCU|nr:hypothetical protein Zmor_027333 [Zophobas morio]
MQMDTMMGNSQRSGVDGVDDGGGVNHRYGGFNNRGGVNYRYGVSDNRVVASVRVSYGHGGGVHHGSGVHHWGGDEAGGGISAGQEGGEGYLWGKSKSIDTNWFFTELTKRNILCFG